AAQSDCGIMAPMAKVSLQTIQTRYRDNAVAAVYDQRYTDWEGSVNRRRMSAVLRRALSTLPAGARVLDVPCGTGVYTWFLAGLGVTTFASDISQEMIAVAGHKWKQAVANAPRFFQGDVFH